MIVTYNHEYARRLRAGFIGCGGHAIRNIYPTFQYAPVDLTAVCDLDLGRAQHVGRMYGAQRFYADYRDMLDKEDLEVVFVVTSYGENAQPRYPAIAADIMQAGAHAWIEKPPAATSGQVLDMMHVSRNTGKFVGVGFKKMFFLANTKAKEIVSKPDYGEIFTITARYPQHYPAYEDRQDAHKMVGFLDHIMHPHSLLRYLAGPLESIHVERHHLGPAVVALRFASGAVGTLHLSDGQSGLWYLERTEIVGGGGTVVVDNNTRVTYYPHRAAEGGYGRAGSFYDTGGVGAQHWEPEFSLGQLYNKGLFLLGYAPEIIDFCACILSVHPPERGNLDDALEMLQIYEAYCQRDGETVKITQVGNR